MISIILILLLTIIAVQIGILVRRARTALVLLASIKIHIREGKEEHWGVLHAIRNILLAQAEHDDRIPPQDLSILRDTPEQLGDNGHWSYHMPSNYLELRWREVALPPNSNDPPAGNPNSGQYEAAKRVLYEAGLL